MFCRVATILCAFLYVGGAHGQESSDTPEAPREYRSFRFALVRIPIWVNDSRGLPVTGLKRRDFKLYVDGRRVAVEGFMEVGADPMETAYLFDLSGSMGMGGKVDASIETVSWMLKRQRMDDRWRMYAFSDDQIVQFLEDRQREQWDILKMRMRGFGRTALYDALAASGGFFNEDSLTNRAVLLFTDGNDNRSSLTEEQMLRVLSVLDVPVFVVAMVNGNFSDHSREKEDLGLHTLHEIAKVSGGELFLVRGSGTVQEVWHRLERRMRPNYMLTITVERGPGEQRRSINVKPAGFGRRSWTVRGRKGYLGSLPTIGGKR
ncbi:MAG: hypothetical protein QNK37_33855 [Acidobacteriota bacterium]|nr:hypothetical protein [Acidobacteriota bacterium]